MMCVVHVLNETKMKMKSMWKMCGAQQGSKNRDSKNEKGKAAMQ